MVSTAYKQARILLLSDENQADGPLKDQEIARALTVGISTVERVRRRLRGGGGGGGAGTPGTNEPPSEEADGSGEAHLIALACGAPPEGRADWTLQLLADRLVECEVVESSYETVRQTLKKTNSSPGESAGASRRRTRSLSRPGSLSATGVSMRRKQGEGDPAAPSTTPRICQSGYQRNGVSRLFAPLGGGWK